MLMNHFKIACRSLIKRKFYSALNIVGLAIGIACALFLYLFISFHLSFDGYHKKTATTYRLVNDILFEQTIPDPGASMGIYSALASDISQVNEAAVMLRNYTFTVAINHPSKSTQRFKEDKNVSLVSPEWFKLFDYKWLAGNPNELKMPNTVALTQKLAVKYFGNINPVGKTILFENRQLVKVVGLISNKPGNTDLKADMYVSLSSLKNLKPDLSDKFFTDWGWINSSTSVYLSLTDVSKKDEVEASIRNMSRIHMPENWKYYRFRLQPLSDVHFNASYGGATQKSLLLTLTIIGLLILAIACINYINLSIAQQAKRSIEIGTRKVLGGTAKQLFMQFMTETVITTFLAMLLAIALVILLLPLANHSLFINEPLLLVSYEWVSIFLALLFLMLIIASGLYPSLVLSRINVFKALRNETTGFKAGFLRKVLIVFQSSVAQILIVSTLIMVLQVRFIKHTDRGFNRDAVILVPLPAASELKRSFFSKRLEEIPNVQSFSFCHKPPSSGNYGGGSVRFENRDWEKWPVNSRIGDTSYVKTFGLQLVTGRNIRELKTGREYLINETMVSRLGLKTAQEAIGKSLVDGELDDQKGAIVGVVKDFNTTSLTTPIGPVLITSYPGRFNMVSIKLKGGDVNNTLKHIKKSYEEVYPVDVFDYQFFDEQIANLYKKEALQEKLIWITTIIAIGISCLGLLGLISLVTLQRTKEIGIRKVLGASVSGIAGLLFSDFLKLVIAAMFVAFPLAWWAMGTWLQNFAHRIEMHWWMFALAGLSAVLIALVTVSFQAVKAALANPVKNLRTE